MARRSPGDGSLYQRKDGLWVAQYQGQYRYSKDKGTAKSKLLKLMTEAEESKPENITVATLMERWFEFASPNLKPSTVKRYGEAIKIYIKPNLGKHKVHTLNAFQVQSLYAKLLSSGTSPTTINLVHSVLSSAFKRAVKWQLVKHNVVRDVDAPRIEAKEVEVFTPDEVQALLTAASGDKYGGVYTLALSTGMRGGEILALQKQDYDGGAGTLDIRRTLILNGSGVGTPKSKNSRRTIHLPDIARDALERHLHKSSGGVWIFPGKTGQNLRYHSFIRFQWKPLVERAGIQYRCFHTCRHYVASELIGRGIPISAVARYLGDTEVTILRTYSHLIKGMETMVPSVMNDVLG